MKQLTIEDLRALIRLIPPARALQEELEKSIHLETFQGTGDLAVRSFQGLQESVYSITEDPYIAALTIHVGEEARDKHLVAQVMLAAGQLVAYLEGQVGISGLTGKQHYSVQTAPTITLNMDGFEGGPAETSRIMDTIDRAIRFKIPKPPKPPKPPQPLRDHHFTRRDVRVEFDEDDADHEDHEDHEDHF